MGGKERGGNAFLSAATSRKVLWKRGTQHNDQRPTLAGREGRQCQGGEEGVGIHARLRRSGKKLASAICIEPDTLREEFNASSA